ncbi:MAG: hypothetical protein WKG00_24050 [Polyangiaceae bacterium]
MRWLLRAAALALLLAPAMGAGCTEDTIEVDVRSLGRSGRVSFLCLDDPAEGADAAHPISDCQATSTAAANDYSVPHLYAAVTQLTRGEVALIDLTTTSEVDDVIDQNTRVPGANFLPVGAQPVDIVSTPGSTATFVAVAEVGRQGIFAIPSTQIRPQGRADQPTLSSWPACSLGSLTPGNMLVVADRPGPDGGVRESCDAPYGPAGGGSAGNPDFVNRHKLLVTLPDEAAIAVIDAQSLAARPPGSFEPCTIERWIPLQVAAGTVPAPDTFPAVGGCVNPEQPEPQPLGTSSRPAGMAQAGDRLYVADLEAPVIHVLDIASPCEMSEREPLLPTSMREPDRPITTSRLAATPGLTSDFKRYLYAIDEVAGSVMAFDISDEGAAPRTPVRRSTDELDPFTFPDRVSFSVPVRDVALVQRDTAEVDDNGVALTGIECDPENKDSLGAKYQSNSSYETGARPGKLRGTFAFLLLSSGQIAIVDIEDFDEKCRKPRYPEPLLGCSLEEIESSPLPYATNESSCNMVTAHSPRAQAFFTWEDEAGSSEPGLSTYPRLTDGDGKSVGDDEPIRPRMSAPLPTDPKTTEYAESIGNTGFGITVGSDRFPIDLNSGLVTVAGDELHDTLVMNLEDPHVHRAQDWNAIWEGPLPGFQNRFAELRIGDTFPMEGLYDATSRFCDAGVQSRDAIVEMLGDVAPDQAQADAAKYADRMVIASELPSEASPHWDVAACTFQICSATFGTSEVRTLARDLPIEEAYQDHLILGTSDYQEDGVTDDLIKCCFPGVVSFEVRPAQQWVVSGSSSGFLHRVIEDPISGKCRSSCDTRLALRNGRVRLTEDARVRQDVTPEFLMNPGAEWGTVFMNPMFRFYISACTPTPGDPSDAPACEAPAVISRDTRFEWGTSGGFNALFISLSQDPSILPEAMTVNPSNGQIAVTDGSFQGLILVSSGTLEESRTYF